MGLTEFTGKLIGATIAGFRAGYHGTCPKCGAIAEGEILFCAQCGTRLPNRHKCSACGTFVKDADFCPSCGKNVKTQK